MLEKEEKDRVTVVKIYCKSLLHWHVLMEVGAQSF